MRVGARLASCKLTLFSGRSATGRTADSEYLFWAEFLFHGENNAPNPQTRMVNFERSGFDFVSLFFQIEYVSSDSDVGTPYGKSAGALIRHEASTRGLRSERTQPLSCI
jgi:hypothetical protein